MLEREDETIADDSDDIAETSAQVAAMRREEARLRAATAATAPIKAVAAADLELPNMCQYALCCHLWRVTRQKNT